MPEDTLMTPPTGTPAELPPASPQTGVPTPMVPLVSEEGVFDPNWHVRLGGDMQVPDRLKGVKDIQTVIKGYTDSQAMIATQGTEIGQLKASLEEGGGNSAPETAAGYAFSKRPEDVPEKDWDQTGVDEWAGVMHEAGLSDAQATALSGHFTGLAARQAEAAAEEDVRERAEREQGLQKEWGRRYDENLANATGVANRIGIDFTDSKVGDNIPLIKALSKLHGAVSESTLKGVGPGSSATEDAAGGRTEARKIVQDSSHPLYRAFHDPSHAQHKEAHQRVDTLNYQHAQLMKGRG